MVGVGAARPNDARELSRNMEVFMVAAVAQLEQRRNGKAERLTRDKRNTDVESLSQHRAALKGKQSRICPAERQ